MASNIRISGLARTFDQYREELYRITGKMYPDILNNINDASIGDWFITLNASIGENLSAYIDRAFQESQLDQAQLRRSLFAIARTQGLRIPGRKASLVEIEVSADIPLVSGSNPDTVYMPVIRKGSQASGNGRVFEFTEDCDFASQFSRTGISNRTVEPKRDSNGIITGYTVRKREVLSGSRTKIYTSVIDDSAVRPFMEVVLPDQDVLSVESVIFKEGTDYKYTPSSQDFAILSEYWEASDGPVWKYFEVDSLLEDKIFSADSDPVATPDNYPQPRVVTNAFGSGSSAYNVSVVAGSWKSVKQKYITEYTDRGYMKIIFGAGSDYGYFQGGVLTPAQQQIRRIMNNGNMGVLPSPGWTMFVQYRTGGGSQSNVATGVVNSLTFRSIFIGGTDSSKRTAVDRSISVTNPSPSIGGKDEPSTEEIRYMIKYSAGSQNRCVTIPDYRDRISKIPAVYGAPYRFGIAEKNNMILISVLGIDRDAHLTDSVSTALIDNISNYLSEYKMITDYVVVRPGKIINIQVEIDVMINGNFSNNDAVRNIIDSAFNFFDTKNRVMGNDIYISSLSRLILEIAGVTNIIEIRVYNIFAGGYSSSRAGQPVVAGYFDDGGIWVPASIAGSTRAQIDLKASDGILFGDTGSMFEVKNRASDIMVRVKNK